MSKGDRKSEYFAKVHALFRKYKKIFIVSVDNVGSSQMHQIRSAIRSSAILLMGKNTMVKKAMRDLLDEMPEIESLMPLIKGNVGLVFTDGELQDVRNAIVANRVGAPAKVGAYIQCDVSIPAGSTGISPDKTSFFQALGISTKVVKGAIEILNDTLLLKEGGRVGASEAELLTMLNIMPFSYGCVVESVYDNGTIFEPAMLDMTDETMLKSYAVGLKHVAAISLALGFPTLASVPHSLINGYKRVLAIPLATDYSFPAADRLKEMLANPAAFATAAAPAAATASSGKAAAAAKVEEKEVSDEEMGFGLFD